MKPKKNTRVKPKKNTRVEQFQLLSFTNKIKRLIRNSSFFKNNSFLKKFYNSVIVRTCFQKENYDSLIRFFILCSYSDLYIYNLDQEYNLPVYPIKGLLSELFAFHGIFHLNRGGL